MTDDARDGLRINIQFKGPLYAATVAQFLGGVELVRLGLTMDPAVEARLQGRGPGRYPYPFYPWYPPGHWDDAEVLRWGAEGLQRFAGKAPFSDLYTGIIAPAIAVAQSQVVSSGQDTRPGVIVKSITEGSLDSVIADAVDFVIEGIGDLFRHLSQRMKRGGRRLDLHEELPDQTRTELGRAAFILGGAAITGTIIELDATDLEVVPVRFDESNRLA